MFICLLVPLITTTLIRYLQGELKEIKFNNIKLQTDFISKKIILNNIQSNLISIFQTMFIFIFSPSFISLTTIQINENISDSFCSYDDAFQRHILISFADGNISNQKQI